MKWYAIMVIVAVGGLVVRDAAKDGPSNCAEACKATGRPMASYSLTAGCVCGNEGTGR